MISFSTKQFAQHHCKMTVEVDAKKHTLNILQELTYYNQSNDTLSTIVLNDWNNAYSDVNTLLSRRFSDEFVRTFHLAPNYERGSTNNITILDDTNLFVTWERIPKKTDLLEVKLRNVLLPNQKIKLHLTYSVKIPSNKFTKYGYGDNDEMNLKNWFLSPARHENNQFITNSNANLDDIANAICDYYLEIITPTNFEITSDLNEIANQKEVTKSTYILSGKNRLDLRLFIEP